MYYADISYLLCDEMYLHLKLLYRWKNILGILKHINTKMFWNDIHFSLKIFSWGLETYK